MRGCLSIKVGAGWEVIHLALLIYIYSVWTWSAYPWKTWTTWSCCDSSIIFGLIQFLLWCVKIANLYLLYTLVWVDVMYVIIHASFYKNVHIHIISVWSASLFLVLFCTYNSFWGYLHLKPPFLCSQILDPRGNQYCKRSPLFSTVFLGWQSLSLYTAIRPLSHLFLFGLETKVL